MLFPVRFVPEKSILQSCEYGKGVRGYGWGNNLIQSFKIPSTEEDICNFVCQESLAFFNCLVIKFLPSLIRSKHKSFFLLWGSIVSSGCLFSFIFQAHSVRLQNGHSVSQYTRVTAMECGPHRFWSQYCLCFCISLFCPGCVSFTLFWTWISPFPWTSGNLCMLFSPFHFLWMGVSGHTYPKMYHLSGFLKVTQGTNMDLIIWCKFPWYMVILIWPVCTVIISPFFWVCLCTFYRCQCKLGFSRNVLPKYDMETTSNVIM